MRALEIKLKKPGPEHVDVAASHNDLGSLHRALDENDQARDYFMHALKIRLKKLGPEHMLMLQALTTIWVLCTVGWAKQTRRKTTIIVHWRLV